MRQKALNWLYKEIRRLRQSLGHAEQKHGVTQGELDALAGKLDILEYLASLVTKEDVE